MQRRRGNDQNRNVITEYATGLGAGECPPFHFGGFMDLREEILGMDDLKSEEITIPEWKGKKFIVREMTGEERGAMYDACMENGKYNHKLHPFAVTVFSLRNIETGERIFTAEDVPALAKKNGGAIESISMVALRLSQLTELDAENAEKN